ncbi:MAG: cytochrome c [Thermomonas sp.]
MPDSSHHHLKAWWAIAIAGALLACAYPLARAADANKEKASAKPLALRKIMQVLDKDMQTVSDGIARADWSVVARIAARITNHPQPPMGERMRILAFIGGDAGKFKEYDKQTKQAAHALEKFAIQGDKRAVISTFSTLQETCLACHQQFRASFQEHFYGRR